MTLGVTNDDNYNDIADALREVGVGMSDATFTPSQMAPAIRGLRSIWGNIEGQLANQSDLQNALNAKANSADLGDMAAEDDAPSDDKQYGRKNGDWVPITDELANWGQISGTLSDQTDLQNALDGKAPLVHDHDDRYYTESEVDEALDLKADTDSVYTKTETDTLLDEKADASSVYTKTETDALLDAKADAADVYDKTETDIVVRDANTAATGHLSGSIVSFNDGADSAFVKDLSVSIEPVQDLHGYDNPWPAGGGINLLDPSKMLPGYIENNGNIHTQNAQKEYYSPDYYEIGSAIKITVGYFGFVSGESKWIAISFYDANKNVIDRLTATEDKSVFTVLEGAVYFRVSMRTFDHGVDYCFSALGNVDSYSPYSNICPISGHSTVAVTRTGKNLYDVNTYPLTSGYSINYPNGASSAAQDYACTLGYIPVTLPEGTVITLNHTPGGVYPGMSFYDTNKNVIAGSGGKGNAIPIPANCAYMRFTVPVAYASGSDVQIELGSTTTTYEPYDGTSVTIDLGEERYGGTLNVLTGEMVVDRVMDIFDGSNDETWTQASSTTDYYINASYVPDRSKAIGGVGITNIYQWALQTGNIPTVRFQNYTPSSNSRRLYILYTKFQNLEELKSALQQTPLQVCYNIKAPFTVQLTPSQMQTILGENHIFASTGDVEVTYCKDTETYVASEINTHHDDTKATVITETASDSIVSFSDGSSLPVESLSVTIEPVQDLHGYDNPWPAGGGKNLLNVTATTQTINGVTFTVNRDSSGNLINITVNGTATENCIFNLGTYSLSAGTYILNGCPSNGSSTTYYIDWRTDDGFQRIDTGSGNSLASEGQTEKMCRIIVVSGVTLSNVVFKPMIRLATETDATFAPYSNICPISGHTSATVTRTGKNLIDDNSETAITFTLPQGTYYAKRFPITTDKQINSKFEALIGNTWTTINSGTYDNGQFVATGGLGWGESPEQTIVLSKSYEFRMSIYTLGSFRGKAHVMLTTGAMPSVYEPYQGTSISIDLDGTHYGGTLDVTTGMLTVTKAGIIFTGTENITTQMVSGYRRFNLYNVPYSIKGTTGYHSSSLYIPSTVLLSTNSINNAFWWAGTSIVWRDDSFGSVTDMKTELARLYSAGTPFQVVGELLTPLTVQLTSSQMQTLLGENHIWADTGDTEVTYRADSKLYIDQKIDEAVLKTKRIIAAVTDTMVAPSNLTAGDFIIVGDDLLKATSNIASGATLTIGSNCVKTTVAEALIALASA